MFFFILSLDFEKRTILNFKGRQMLTKMLNLSKCHRTVIALILTAVRLGEKHHGETLPSRGSPMKRKNQIGARTQLTYGSAAWGYTVW